MVVQGHSGIVTIHTTPLQSTIEVKTPIGSALTTGDSKQSVLLAAQLINKLYHMPI